MTALPEETRDGIKPETDTPTGSKARKVDWPTVGLVTLVVALGLALRLWGIGWSLPNARHPLATYHPDELVNLAATQKVDIPHGQFDTQFYNYGTFYFYLASFGQTIGQGYGLIPPTPAAPAGTPPSPVESMVRQAPERAGLFLAGRLTTVLLGVATIPLLFALGSRLWERRVGLVAALLYAVAPLAVVHAHFMTVDVPATFFVTLALFAAARLLDVDTMSVRQAWLAYVFAGVACGLCAATKYNTGLVLVAPIVAHSLNRTPEACRLHRKAHFGVMLIAAGFAFIIACPGPLLNWDVFWNGTYEGSGVRYELFQHSREGHGLLFVNTGPGWWYHLIVSLPHGLGVPLLAWSLAGVVYACKRRDQGDRILLAFFALYFVTTSLSAVRFARYMLPLFPVFCLFAARLTCAPFVNPVRRLISQAFGTLVLFFAGGYAFSLTRQMTLTDPRDQVAAYLDSHAAPGASVAFGTIPWFYSPPLSPRFGEMAPPRRALAAQEVTRYELRIPEHEWDRSVLAPPPDYVVLSDIETMHPRLRLHQTQAVEFTNQFLVNYHEKVFAPAPLWFASVPIGPIIPEDLLYIMPTLTVYEHLH